VERELFDLNMGDTGFMVSFGLVEGDDDLVLSDGSTCGFTRDGIDDVEFLIRPNPGEPFMSLARTASTGETSRLMLALRCALSRGGPVPTLVFDEIDMGVGGRSGEIIGKKLALLAREHQVICITHLPQVAAYGDSQYSVSKRVAGDRTYVEIAALQGAGREAELSDMLGSLGEPSMFGAQELLQRAASWKGSLVR
jgi:DNA repair protein RecN (Recombination protein N)